MRIVLLIATTMVLSGCVLLRSPPIFRAVSAGDTARVAKILAQDQRRANANNFFTTILGWAVECNETESVKLLLKHGADINRVTQFNERLPIHELTSKNSDLHRAEHPEGETLIWVYVPPLWIAMVERNIPMAKLLLARGADPNASISESCFPPHHVYTNSCLHGAVALGDLDVVRLLIKHGADVNDLTWKFVQGADEKYVVAEGFQSRTPLRWAKVKGDQKIVEFLKLNGGVDVPPRPQLLPDRATPKSD